MAKHLARAAVRRKQQYRRRTVRLAISSSTAVVAVLAAGFQASGSVTPSGVTSGKPEGSITGAQLSTSGTAALTVPVDARLTYTRSMVRTEARKQTPKVNVSAARARPAEGTLEAPLEILVSSSPFGLRTSPFTGAAGEFHWGMDFSASCGTRVHSTDNGVVRKVGWHPLGGGNRVEIDHGNGLVTTYNHLQGIAVHAGQLVQAGELIAKVGTTGASTGCHLHFETILNGTYIDPAKWELQPLRSSAVSGGTKMTDYQKATPATSAAPWTVPSAPQLSNTAAKDAKNAAPAAAQEQSKDSR